MIVRKSDGTCLYATTDLAALRHRLGLGGAPHGGNALNRAYDRIIYVVDSSQSRHFRQLFRVAGLAGWCEGQGASPSLEHVAFGLVKGADDRKLSSRAGGAPTLAGLVDEVYDAALLTVRRRSRDDGAEAPGADAPGAEGRGTEAERASAEKVMRGALRYFELSHHRQSDYAASVDRMLAVKGNTSVSLLYACARISSLLERAEAGHHAEADGRSTAAICDLGLADGHPKERELRLAIARFPETLDAVAAELTPHLLCNYLFGLASVFHSFYSNERIIGHEREAPRLALCRDVQTVLRSGLGLLGVPVVERI
jgi:arginyl-tRNA synthetase